MSEDRRVSAMGDLEKKDLSKYVAETRIFCPACGPKTQQHLYVKSYIDTAANLECPNCDHTTTVAKGTEALIKK
jgi:ribosomal protein S27AE